jgi:hypothetical protein
MNKFLKINTYTAKYPLYTIQTTHSTYLSCFHFLLNQTENLNRNNQRLYLAIFHIFYINLNNKYYKI